MVFREESVPTLEEGLETVEFHHCGRGRDKPDELGVLSLLWDQRSPQESPPGGALEKEAAGA